MYLYKYAILKFFLPNLWRKNHSHSSACTVYNGKYMYSSFKHLKEPKGMAEKVQTPTKESKVTWSYTWNFAYPSNFWNFGWPAELWIKCFVSELMKEEAIAVEHIKQVINCVKKLFYIPWQNHSFPNNSCGLLRVKWNNRLLIYTTT